MSRHIAVLLGCTAEVHHVLLVNTLLERNGSSESDTLSSPLSVLFKDRPATQLLDT